MITIAICTYNRASMLRDTLESFLGCDHADIDFEVVVVDNNSKDDTREVVEFFSRRHSFVRYFFEKRQGLSAARNAAIQEARGDIVSFVDDDVYFDEKWLVALNDFFSSSGNVDCVAGRVFPEFEVPRPVWVRDEILWIYGVTKYGDSRRDLCAPEVPIGCNMAFRKELVSRVGVFDCGLGRKGASLLSNEESEFFDRIYRLGARVAYCPEMAVRHRVTPDRLEREWIKRRYYWQGVSDVALQLTLDKRPSRFEVLFYGFALLWKNVRSVFGSASRPRHVYWAFSRFDNQLRLLYGLGAARGALSSVIFRIT